MIGTIRVISWCTYQFAAAVTTIATTTTTTKTTTTTTTTTTIFYHSLRSHLVFGHVYDFE
jgi:hypothetical protein